MVSHSKYKLSVFITTYNMERYIERALDSVLLQNIDFSMEIVVADDASTDRTVAILESYATKNQHMKILRSEANNGLITNFVRGLKECCGEYIATLDADDYWIEAHKLKDQVAFLDSNPEYGYVFTNYYNEYETAERRVVGLKNLTINHDVYSQMLLSPYVQISTPLLRKSLLSQVELDDFVNRNFQVQDYPLFLSLCQISKGHFIDEITTAYTIRNNSMSHESSFEKQISYYSRCHEIGNYFISKKPISKGINERREFDFHFKLLLKAWEANNFEKVEEFSKKLSTIDFIRFNKKALYIFSASKYKQLYKLVRPWVIRQRTI